MPRKKAHVPLAVYLNGHRVGSLLKQSSGAIEFAYAHSWLAWEHTLPVSLSLPLREAKYIGAPVAAVFENLLPDSALIRTRVAERVGAFGGRDAFEHGVAALLDGKPQTWLAAQAGISISNLNDIVRKSMPAADTAIRIAQALDVTAEFLFTGENVSGANPLMAADQADWVMVPRYRLADFTETGKPEPIETIPIRKDWLNQTARVASNLWLTDLPSTVDAIGEEGDPILCRDAETHHQEGWYLYFFEGMPIVRKVAGPVFGQLGDVQRPWDYQIDESAGLRLVARILGTFKLKSI